MAALAVRPTYAEFSAGRLLLCLFYEVLFVPSFISIAASVLCPSISLARDSAADISERFAQPYPAEVFASLMKPRWGSQEQKREKMRPRMCGPRASWMSREEAPNVSGRERHV